MSPATCAGCANEDDGVDVMSLRIDVFSLFPQLVENFCAESLLGKAQQRGLLDLRAHDIREQT